MEEYGDLGVVDYELYLLRTMQAPEGHLARGLRELGHTAESMNLIADKVSSAVKLLRTVRPLKGSAANLKGILRDAWVADIPEGEGMKSIYRLPLWPEFIFTVLVDVPNEIVNWARFTRDPENPGEPVLEPWRFLEDDIPATFLSADILDPWGHYVTYSAVMEGVERPYYLQFGWGLLQEVGWIEGEPELWEERIPQKG